ncbi:MAG: hypothetical protein CMB96_04600 [Flavobacteriaceae bacterium]|nr:hypothetical protein [Flavobacteriaceae bacterium]|tara:strand:+ start:253 stop:636 length:384 start_codon:yes stop_codon:yes gene_type:complete
MQNPDEKLDKQMAALTITPNPTLVITPPKKRKRHISFFDGDGCEKPRPEMTVTYDRLNGNILSIKTFDEERKAEQDEYNQWLEAKRQKRIKKQQEKDAKTPEQDLEDMLAQLSYIPLDISNLISNPK